MKATASSAFGFNGLRCLQRPALLISWPLSDSNDARQLHHNRTPSALVSDVKCKSEEMRHQSRDWLKGCDVQVRSPTGTTAARAPRNTRRQIGVSSSRCNGEEQR